MAIIIEENQKRAVHLAEPGLSESIEFSQMSSTGSDCDTNPQFEDTPHLSRIQDHLFKLSAAVSTLVEPFPYPPTSEQGSAAKGLQLVGDFEFAKSERIRLATMLEEFAQHHINSR